MRSISSVFFFILIFPCILSGARLQLEVPPGMTDVYLLSSGTPSVLKHLQDQLNLSLDQLNTRYQIERLAEQKEKATNLVKGKKRAYANKLSSLQTQYIASLSLNILSTDAEVSPSSSALGDVSFFYSIKNNSDRIITDITYKPKIGGITLPTTSSLMLDLIHPQTLKSGLGPKETISNKGHEPERFSFFIGELSKEELKKIQSEIKKDFTIEVIDMHFTKEKDYKGQTEVLEFEGAFNSQLKPLQIAIADAEADEQSKKISFSNALSKFNKAKETVMNKHKKSLEDLKKTSVRYQIRPDEKNLCILENIPAKKYIVYSRKTNGQALFTEITVEDRKNKLMLNTMIKDPFSL
jgi:hypothetical protein